jgi:hypothetical protein
MNRIICLVFFFVGLILMAADLYEYYRIQHQFQDSSLVPIILLGILAHFAFAPPAKPAA